MKRAQGLPLNTIIIAILLIVVLVAVSFWLMRGGGVFTKATSECAEQGGACVERASDCIAEGGIVLDFTCPKEKPACCRR